MDPAAKQATRERIAALRAAGTTILLTTHELGDVERLADHVAVLDRGRIVAARHAGRAHRRRGAAGPVPARPRRSRRRTAARSPRRSAAGRSSSHGARARATRSPGCTSAPDPRLVAALAAWCAERGLLLTELRLGAASLEERYLELVGGTASTSATRRTPDA